MKYLLAAGVLMYLALLTLGALTGRIKARNGCCAPADPAKDLRMRGSRPDPGQS